MGRRSSSTNVIFSQFYCVNCGNRGLDIPRRKGAEREAGHLKKLFCLKCQRETNHAECKPFSKYDFEQFKEEFEYNNFTEEGLRKKPYNKLKELINHGKIERKKTLVNCGDSRSW